MKKVLLELCVLLLTISGFAQNKNIAYQDETVRFTVVTDGVILL